MQINTISFSDKSNFPSAIPIIAQELSEHGICVVDLGYDDNCADTLLAISEKIGLPHKHNKMNNILWDVKPYFTNTKNSARSHTYEKFDFHTDCSYENNVPDYIGLQVIQNDRFGGGSNLISPVKKILEQLPKYDRDILQSQPVKISVPQEFKKTCDYINACILDKNENIRFRKDIIDINSLSNEQNEAILKLTSIAYQPQVRTRLCLNKNQILLLDNKKYLHARTNIYDTERHLVRTRFFKKSGCYAT